MFIMACCLLISVRGMTDGVGKTVYEYIVGFDRWVLGWLNLKCSDDAFASRF